MSDVADSNGCVSRYMYCASAPGKVILFGEHSVVYGQPAVAAALSDLRIFVGVESIPRNEPEGQNIRITMKDLPNPVDLSIPIDDFIAVTSQLTSPPSTECTQALEAFIRAKSQLRTNCIMDDPSIHAILPVLYLISQLLPMSVLCDFGCIVTVRSVDLPVGAGLGSSAAFSVACAAALIQWKYHRNRFTVSNGTSPRDTVSRRFGQNSTH
jgi:mevalonate kinase